MKDRFDQTNFKTVTKTFTVSDEDAPAITFKEGTVTFTEGDGFDPKANIDSVIDNRDGDITANEELVTIESNVEDKEGNYTVVVHATDTLGNTAKQTYQVTVEPKPVVVQTQTTTTSTATNYQTSYTATAATSYQATATQTVSEPVQQAAPAVNYGSAGRIYLSNGYSAAAYAGSLWDAGGTQGIINNGDSAFVDYSFNYIADHAGQGFWFDYGTTLTWVYANGSSKTYTCTSVMTGPKGSWTCDQGFDVLDNSGGRLITQTCSGNGLIWAYWS